MTIQGDEGGPSKRIRATRKKKVLEGEEIASQLREEFELRIISHWDQPETG
jgi:hypothetical protein